MRQYQVPQFITIEDKVIGPLTLKQFGFLLLGGIAILILYKLLPFFLFFILAAPIGIFSLLLAFYKHEGRPFPKVVASAVAFYLHPKLYIWKKLPEEPKKRPMAPKEDPTTLNLPATTESKIADLAWSLDVKRKMKR